MISLPVKRGEFVALEASSGTIGTGVTGDILTVTPPSGRRVRLTHLSTTSGSSQTDISITLGIAPVLVSQSISGYLPQANSGRYSIGRFQPYTAGAPPSGNHPFITGKTDEALIISKGAGNTGIAIYYAYEFGE